MRHIRLQRVTACLLALALLTGIFLPSPVDIFSVTVYAEDGSGDSEKSDRDHEGKQNISEDVDYFNDINIDESFEYQIKMATNYANRMMSGSVPIGNEDNSYSQYLKMDNVAVFFGYTDGEIDTGVLLSPSSVRTGSDSASSIAYSRANLSKLVVGDTVSVAQYADYGLMLKLLGLDDVGSDSVDSRRSIFGVAALGAYYAASSVNILFELMFDVLEAANPFQFFKEINTTNSGSSALQGIASAAEDAAPKTKSVFQKLSHFFSEIFNTFSDFAWAVSIPLAIVFIIIAVFLTRNGTYRFASNVKKLLIRVVFLVVGIPILGSAYTEVLDKVKEANVASDEFITQAVSYTFVDFSAWVKAKRLDPSAAVAGSGIDGSHFGVFDLSYDSTYKSTDCVIFSDEWLKLRQMASAINENCGVFDLEGTDYLKVGDDSGAVLKNIDSATWAVDTNSGSVNRTTQNNRQAVINVITKYMHGDRYSASDFQSGVVNALQVNEVKNYGDLFALSCNKYSFSSNAEQRVTGLQSNTGEYYDPDEPKNSKTWGEVALHRFNDFSGWSNVNIWNNGKITAGNGGSSGGSMTYTGGSTTGNNTGLEGSTGLEGLDPATKCGFSTMAMYVYLTTEFSQDALTVYGGAPSVYTQNSHYAVNLVGGNYIMQFAFYINMMAIMVGYFILALTFVFLAAFDILFKGIQFMGHALLAAAGFYKSIGTTICMTVNMIAQLFVTVIFFPFMIDLMFLLPSVFDNFLVTIFENVIGQSGLNTISGSFVTENLVIVANIMSTFVLVFFVSFAIRWSAVIMSSINSMIEQIMSQLLGVSLSGASTGYAGNIASSALNDTMNIAKTAAAAGGAIALVGESQEMLDDFTGALGADGEDGVSEVSAADAAANTTEGANFNGGKGTEENNSNATKEEAEQVLNEGLGEKETNSDNNSDSSSSDSIDSASTKESKESETNNSDTERTAEGEANTSDDVDGNGAGNRGITGYYYGGTSDGVVAAKQNADGSLVEGFHRDEHGNIVADRTTANVDTANVDKVNVADTSNATSDGAESDLEVETTEGGTISTKPDAPASNGQPAGTVSKKDASTTNTAETSTATVDTSTAETSTATVDTSTAETADVEAESNGVTSSVTTGDNGLEIFSQTNDATGTATTASYDISRGLVLSQTNADGTVSDIAIGENGLSVGTTDENGNYSVTEVGSDGVNTTYTSADGTTETVTASGEGSKVVRTDKDGNTETLVMDENGAIASSVETAADGSTRKVSVDTATGDKVVDTYNAETGYASTEAIDAETGETVKTESINGTKVVTKSDADGNITEQTTSGVDSNGNAVTSILTNNDDGTQTYEVASNGVKTTTVTNTDGTSEQTESVVLSDGKTAETTTQYDENGAVSGNVKTVVKSADGSVVGTSVTSTGSDGEGSYTLTSTSTSDGQVDVKSYDSGKKIFAETTDAGTTTTVQNTDGTYDITATDTAANTTTTTSVAANGATHSVTVDNSTGNEIATADTVKNKDGSYDTVSYDANANETTVAHISSTGTGSATVYSGNGQSGDNVLRTEEISSNAQGSITVETRGASGNVEQVAVLDADTKTGVVTSYDVNGGVSSVDKIAAGAAYTTAAGATIAMTNEGVSTAFTTDAGNVITAAATGAAAVATVSAAGSMMSMSTLGTGSSAEATVEQRFASTGGSYVQSTNLGSNNVTTVQTDGLGGQTHTVADSSTGASTTQFVSANGNNGTVTIDGSGNYSENVQLASGGTRYVTRTGTGDDTVQIAGATDAAGNGYEATTSGGRLERVVTMSGGSATTAQLGSSGEIMTDTVRMDGSNVQFVKQSNGDYVETVTDAFGRESQTTSVGGKVTHTGQTLTGVNYSSVSDGSAVTHQMQFDSLGMQYSTDTASNATSATYTTMGGQSFGFINNGSGEAPKMTFDMGDGNYGSMVQTDSGYVNIIRNANGSGVVNTMQNGQLNTVYTDANGETVAAPTGADGFNTYFAQAMTGFAQTSASVNNVPMGGMMENVNASPMYVGSLNLTNPDVNIPAETPSLNLGGSSEGDSSGNISLQTSVGSSGTKRQINIFEKLFKRNVGSDEENIDVTDLPESPLENHARSRMSVENQNTSLPKRDTGGQWGEMPTDKGGSTTGTSRTK